MSASHSGHRAHLRQPADVQKPQNALAARDNFSVRLGNLPRALRMLSVNFMSQLTRRPVKARLATRTHVRRVYPWQSTEGNRVTLKRGRGAGSWMR